MNSEIQQALRELEREDSLLHRAMALAVTTFRSDTGLDLYEEVLERLLTYDRSDIEWGLDFTESHHDLREYWASAIHWMNADHFSLYLDRLDDLWERMTNLPGVEVHTAWKVLAGYPEKDPGGTRKEGSAVFLINAALLASMRRANAKPEQSGLTKYVRYTNYSAEALDELSPKMIQFACEHADDVDRIVEIILQEDLWHPEAITYRLDGNLVPRDAAESLGYPMLCDLYHATKTRAAVVQSGTHTVIMEEKLRAIAVNATNGHFQDLIRKIEEADLEYLSLRSSIVPKHAKDDWSLNCSTMLDLIISNLRSKGHRDLSCLTTMTLKNAHNAYGVAVVERTKPDSHLSKLAQQEFDEYCSALVLAVVLGPESVGDYIGSQPEQTLKMTMLHGVTSHEDVINVVREGMKHGVLVEGAL